MSHPYVGMYCPFCGKPLQETEAVVVCDTCGRAQHLACWQQKQGCTVPGCTGSIRQVYEPESPCYPPGPQAPAGFQNGPAAPVPPEKPKKKKRTGLIITLCVAGAVLIAGAVLAILFYFVPQGRYDDAVEMLEHGNFNGAYEEFEELGEFRDSPEKMKETRYQQAEKLLKKQEFEEASRVFQKLGRYQDSEERSRDALYQGAAAALEAQDFETARSLYGSLGNYKDSADMLSETDYQEGLSFLEQGDRDSARLLFSGLGDYKDCPELLKELTYEEALSCMEEEDYEKAAELFDSIPDYLDACDWAVSARLALAGQLYEQGDYEPALTVLEGLPDSPEKEDLWKPCAYGCACQLMDGEDYEPAIGYLEQLTDFSDGAELLKEAKLGYVQTHPNRKDETTCQYLQELTAENYGNSTELYDELYAWTVTGAFHTEYDTDSPVVEQVPVNVPELYLLFTLEGGTPGETVNLGITIYSSSGKNTCEDIWLDVVDGKGMWAAWQNGIFPKEAWNNPKNIGTFHAEIFITETEEVIGTFFLEITAPE